jgi:hypothetical protein
MSLADLLERFGDCGFKSVFEFTNLLVIHRFVAFSSHASNIAFNGSGSASR